MSGPFRCHIDENRMLCRQINVRYTHRKLAVGGNFGYKNIQI